MQFEMTIIYILMECFVVDLEIGNAFECFLLYEAKGEQDPALPA